MSAHNPIQFAITREDASIELNLIEKFTVRKVLAVCSGGDTLLALKHTYPKLEVAGFDLNPHQINHFKDKIVRNKPLNHEPDGLCQLGNFESLFRQWRNFVNEFILSKDLMYRLFKREDDSLRDELLSNKYWPVSFDLHFHESFLRAMFGEAAIQHAPKGTYPRYFQKAFEKGILNGRFEQNPFVQHLFLGEYVELPEYFQHTFTPDDFQLYHCDLFSIPRPETFDLIQLSNIFDWSSLPEVSKTCEYLNDNMKKGSVLLIRQINNEAPVPEFLGENFIFHTELARQLQSSDRSLFYSKLIIAEKR